MHNNMSPHVAMLDACFDGAVHSRCNPNGQVASILNPKWHRPSLAQPRFVSRSSLHSIISSPPACFAAKHGAHVQRMGISRHQVPPSPASPSQLHDDGLIRITYKPAPPRVPEPEFGFPPPRQPELSDLQAALDSAQYALQHATSHEDKVQLCIAMDQAARRLQQAGDWLARADHLDVDSWLAVNKVRKTLLTLENN